MLQGIADAQLHASEPIVAARVAGEARVVYLHGTAIVRKYDDLNVSE